MLERTTTTALTDVIMYIVPSGCSQPGLIGALDPRGFLSGMYEAATPAFVGGELTEKDKELKLDLTIT
jgi:hypothetical protein